MLANKYYTYVYLDPRKPGYFKYHRWKFDHEPIYVGKGTGRRWLSHLSGCSSNVILKRRIDKMRKSGLEPIIQMKSVKITEKEAHDLEIRLIADIGRINTKTGPLCNLTDGGEGASGCLQSKRVRERHSEGHKNRSLEEKAKTAELKSEIIQDWYANSTKEQRTSRSRNISLSKSSPSAIRKLKKFWKAKTSEEMLIINKKRSDSHQSRSSEDKARTSALKSKNGKAAHARRSAKDKELLYKKLSEINSSPEVVEKQRIARESKSIEERRATNKKRRDSGWNNKTDAERADITRRRIESLRITVELRNKNKSHTHQ